MADACGVTTPVGSDPDGHEVIPIRMLMVVVSTPTPLSANCCIGTIEPSSAGDQRRTTTVLHASSELGGHMDGNRPSSIEVAPLQADGSLYGFMLLGRWPNDTVEWARFLVLAVQMAAVPGLLPTSTVFRVREELPEEPHPGAIGLVVAEGQLLGDHPLRPGHFAAYQPPGLIVLHPPSSTLSSVPEYQVASGCVFLPGLPYLGLDHRAAWVEADVDGTVTQLISKVGIDPQVNADTAALAMLLAA